MVAHDFVSVLEKWEAANWGGLAEC